MYVAQSKNILDEIFKVMLVITQKTDQNQDECHFENNKYKKKPQSLNG